MNWSVSQTRVFPIAYVTVILIAVIIGVLLHNKNDKIKNIPFFVITSLLLITEVIKQVKSIQVGYNSWDIPLHFCSMFLLWFSMASFFRGNTKKVGHYISYVTGFAFLIAFIIGPTTIIGGATDNLTFTLSNFDALHTFYYHFAVVLFFLLQISLRIPYPTLQNLKEVAIPFFSWMAFAAIMANVTNTNFSNLLYNNVLFMQSIKDSFGYIPYLISMFFVFFILLIGILTLGNLLKILETRVKLKKENTVNS